MRHVFPHQSVISLPFDVLCPLAKSLANKTCASEAETRKSTPEMFSIRAKWWDLTLGYRHYTTKSISIKQMPRAGRIPVHPVDCRLRTVTSWGSDPDRYIWRTGAQGLLMNGLCASSGTSVKFCSHRSDRSHRYRLQCKRWSLFGVGGGRICICDVPWHNPLRSWRCHEDQKLYSVIIMYSCIKADFMRNFCKSIK